MATIISSNPFSLGVDTKPQAPKIDVLNSGDGDPLAGQGADKKLSKPDEISPATVHNIPQSEEYDKRLTANAYSVSSGGFVSEQSEEVGRERNKFTHPSGTSREYTPDGGFKHIIKGDKYTLVAGDDSLTVYGDVNMNVTGNLTQKVGGDHIMEIQGSQHIDIKGSQFVDVNTMSMHTTNGWVGHISKSSEMFISGALGLRMKGLLVDIDAFTTFKTNAGTNHTSSVGAVHQLSAENMQVSARSRFSTYADESEAYTGGSAIHNSGDFTFMTGDIEIQGAVTMKQTLDVEQEITSKIDVIAVGVSLVEHFHKETDSFTKEPIPTK